MLAMLVNFVDLTLAALVSGTLFGAWLIFNPKGLDGPRYVALQQQGIRRLNTPMPIFGGLTILATVFAAVLAAQDEARLTLLITAIMGFVAAGAITRFLNQPINAIVITWPAESPPAQWRELRDKWWRWHKARLLCAVAGLAALILANLLAAGPSWRA